MQPNREEMDWLAEMDAPVPGAEQLDLTPDHHEYTVVGPPGTGKTTWLTRQVTHAAARYSPADVCVGSLTRAAAAEVAGRDTLIPKQNIGTLHAHAFRALERPPLAEVAEGVKAWNDTCGFAGWRLTAQGNIDGGAIENIFGNDGNKLLGHISRARSEQQPEEVWPSTWRNFYAAWCAFKTDTHRLDFTDLIERAADEIDRMPGDPAVIMLDEAQDMSALEMRLARKWGDAADQLVVVGDPDQCLYSWRGADPSAVFGHDVSSVQVLSQSYRVPAAVHEAAVNMIERIPDRLAVTYHPRADSDGQPVLGELRHSNLAWKDPAPIINTARREMEMGRSVMVLTSCGYMLYPLLAELKEQGEPFHNPYRVTQGAWNPLRAARRLLAFLRPLSEAWGEDNRMWTWDDLRAWIEPMQAKGYLEHGTKTLIEHKCARNNLGQSDADNVPEISRVLSLFKVEHVEHVVNLDVEWWHRSLRMNDQKRNRFAMTCYHRHGARSLHDTPRLTVGTTHSVKGGEADSVIVMPDLSSAGYWDGLHRPGDPQNSVIRQFYVAMTRAREKLILGQASGLEAIAW